jgi:tetratricopeptide (TPR) repeat protein
MLTIFASTEVLEMAREIINSEFRLNEVAEIKDISKINGHKNFLIVDKNEIKIPLRWSNEIPPYLLSDKVIFSKENLLAVVYLFLNNFEKAYYFAQLNPSLLKDIDTINRLQHGITLNIDADKILQTPFESYRHRHNAAILSHYGETTQFLNVYHVNAYYQKALDAAPNGEYFAFTGKHFATLMLDADELGKAEAIIEKCLTEAISDEAKTELKNIQYGIWMKRLTIPYNEMLLVQLKNTLWEVLEYYERQQNQVQVAMLLTDAAHIANISNSFSEALGYINRAVSIFESENIPELLANAQYRKGILLYTWAQNGNPQFFKPAMEAYQQALKIFTFENTPEIFAEIQHHLGVIYSEIPDEVQKKSLWAAISVSSFNQALQYFRPTTHPYEYAMVCNSYGNALTKYPPSVKTDNYAKALSYYRQSLEIRNAEEYPTERVLTIMNFLEAAWLVSHPNEAEEKALFDEMVSLANEIKQLTTDGSLIADAERHLERIGVLKGHFIS